MSTQMWSCPKSDCLPVEHAPTELSLEEVIAELFEHAYQKPVNRYRPDAVGRWLVERNGPHARCAGECGEAYPLREFKIVTDS
jgi:hypothetical protein